MKKIMLLSALASILVTARAQEDSGEYYSFFQNVQIDTCSALKINRKIEGGTKIIAEFEGQWDEDMKGAFCYACKIWEENLPTMLPVTIKAETGTFRGSNSNALSRVLMNKLQNNEYEYGIAPQARYLLFQDYTKRVPCHFTTIEDSLDLCRPDIIITYNKNLFNTETLSFSLDTCSTDKIDFVTQALRDIAAGLGFCTHFVPQNGHLDLPDSMKYVGLERMVKEAISTENANEAYTQATQGSLPLYIDTYGTLNLYAPPTWQQGVSLNRFYPQSTSGVSQLLTWNFGKGTIIRDITDRYEKIFKNGFLWISDIPTGGGSTDFNSCNNNDAISYNGEITAYPPSSQMLTCSPEVIEQTENSNVQSMNDGDNEVVFDYMTYCKAFDPTLSMNGAINEEKWTFSILMNDGTWDVIAERIDPWSPFEISLSDITFHYPDSVYARSTDGLLRGRVSNNKRQFFNNRYYNETSVSYYVLEYLPQKAERNLAKVHDDSYLQDEYLRDIEIAMSNLEGTTNVYVEQLEEGDIFPSLTLLQNPKEGRFTATVDKEYTSEFTIVSYNANGHKRSNTLTVEALEPAELNINVESGRILVTYGHKNKLVEDCSYTVCPASPSMAKTAAMTSGKCLNGEIPTGAMGDGMNIIKVVHPNGKTKSIKIVKSSSQSNKATISVVI